MPKSYPILTFLLDILGAVTAREDLDKIILQQTWANAAKAWIARCSYYQSNIDADYTRDCRSFEKA